MSDEDYGFRKLLIVPVTEVRALSRSIDQRAVVSGTFEVAADLPKNISAHAVASAVAALIIGNGPGGTPAADWTIDAETGRSNSSPLYERLCREVEMLIRDGGGHCLDPGWTRRQAALIMSQLAHVHGLAPVAEADRS